MFISKIKTQMSWKRLQVGAVNGREVLVLVRTGFMFSPIVVFIFYSMKGLQACSETVILNHSVVRIPPVD